MEQAIEIFSPTWWTWIASTVIFYSFLLLAGIKVNEKQKLYISWLVAGILFLSATLIHPYLYYTGKWSIQSSLPLHMCTIAQWLAIFVLLSPRQWLFDVLVYWGIAGGINAMLTPQPLHGLEFQVLLGYFTEHGGIVFTPVFLALAYNRKPSNYSWIKVFFFTQLILILMAAFNYHTGSNYFFIFRKPIAQNPLIIGDWPYYIIGFQIIGLIQFYMIYYFFKKYKKNLVFSKKKSANKQEMTYADHR